MLDLFDEARHYPLTGSRASRIDLVFGWLLAAIVLVTLVAFAAQ